MPFKEVRKKITDKLRGGGSRGAASETPSETTAARKKTMGEKLHTRFMPWREKETSQGPIAEGSTSKPGRTERLFSYFRTSNPVGTEASPSIIAHTEVISREEAPIKPRSGKELARSESSESSESDRDSDSDSVSGLKIAKDGLDRIQIDTLADIPRWTDRAKKFVEGHRGWLQGHTSQIDTAPPPTELPNFRQMQETTSGTIRNAYDRMRSRLLEQHNILLDPNQILADLDTIKPPYNTYESNRAHTEQHTERLIDIYPLYQAYNLLKKVRMAYSEYNPTGTLPIKRIVKLHRQAMQLSKDVDDIITKFCLSGVDLQQITHMTPDNVHNTLQDGAIPHDDRYNTWRAYHVSILRKRINEILTSICNKADKDLIDMRKDFFRWTRSKDKDTIAGKSRGEDITKGESMGKDITEGKSKAKDEEGSYAKLESTLINCERCIAEINANPDQTNEEMSALFMRAMKGLKDYDKQFGAFRQERKGMGIEGEWVQEGMNRTQNAENNLRKRRERDGMTREVVEESYTAHYRHLVEPVSPAYWNLKRFGQMVENGMMRGEMKDWTFVGMEPKMPDGFDGVDFQGSLVLKALVSFHSDEQHGNLYGSIVNINADLVDDNRWRDKHYGEYRAWLNSEKLESLELPKKYSAALHPSELTRKAYQLAWEEHKRRHGLDPNTSAPPIREFIGFDIVYPGSREPLHGYGEAGQAVTFKRGNQEGDKVVNLARCTHYGPRPEFLKLDDPGLVPGEIGSATIYRELNDKGEEHKMHLKFTMVEA